MSAQQTKTDLVLETMIDYSLLHFTVPQIPASEWQVFNSGPTPGEEGGFSFRAETNDFSLEVREVQDGRRTPYSAVFTSKVTGPIECGSHVAFPFHYDLLNKIERNLSDSVDADLTSLVLNPDFGKDLSWYSSEVYSCDSEISALLEKHAIDIDLSSDALVAVKEGRIFVISYSSDRYRDDLDSPRSTVPVISVIGCVGTMSIARSSCCADADAACDRLVTRAPLLP